MDDQQQPPAPPSVPNQTSDQTRADSSGSWEILQEPQPPAPLDPLAASSSNRCRSTLVDPTLDAAFEGSSGGQVQLGSYCLDKSPAGRLGKGQFASVFKGTDHAGHSVAFKVLAHQHLFRAFTQGRTGSAAEQQLIRERVHAAVEREIALSSSCKHRNVVQLHQVLTGSQHHFLVLDYCNCGTLADWLNKHGKLSPDIALDFTRQLAWGLMALDASTNGSFVHR